MDYTNIAYQSSYLVHGPSKEKKGRDRVCCFFLLHNHCCTDTSGFIADLFGTCYPLVTEAGCPIETIVWVGKGKPDGCCEYTEYTWDCVYKPSGIDNYYISHIYLVCMYMLYSPSKI